MSTPSIPGVDSDSLITEIMRDAVTNGWSAIRIADVAIAHIAAHHECACDREHADEWVEVGEAIWNDLPNGARRRREWAVGVPDWGRLFVHRDDLPDPRAIIARELGPASAATFLGLLEEHGWAVKQKGEQ